MTSLAFGIAARAVLVPLVLCLALPISNCASSRNEMTFFGEQAKYYQQYAGEDIIVAEQALWDIDRLATEYESKHIQGIDYHTVRGFVYVRLALVYQHRNLEEQAVRFLEIGMQHFAIANHTDVETLRRTSDRGLDIVRRLDREKGVKWAQGVGN